MALDLPRQAGPRPGITSRRSTQLAHDISFLMAVTTVVVFLLAASTVGPHLVRSAGRALGTVSGPFQRHEPLARHRLRVLTHPEGAALQVQASGGSSRKARTPFVTRVPGGEAGLTLSLPGYNTLKQTVDLGRNRSLDLWLDPKGQILHKLGQFDTGPAPKQVAFTPDGSELWIADLGGGVDVFDAATGRRTDHVSLGGKSGVEVVFNRAGTLAYVSQMETASVFQIDVATRKVRRQMFTTGSWSKVMTLSPDEKTLFVSNWVSDDVSQIDLATGQEVRRFLTVDTPRGLYVTPDGNRLYVAGFGDGRLERFDLATLRSKIVLDTGGALRHLVGDPVRQLLYVDDMAKDQVYVVDLATEHARLLARTDDTPNTIDLSPDGRVLFVSNRGRNNPKSYYLPGPEWGSVLAIDTATGRILDAVIGGNQTTGLDVSPDGKVLAFTDFLDNRVSLYAIPSYVALAAGGGGRAVSHLADLEK